MRIGRAHWMLALSGALLVHAGAAVAILWQPAESGAVSAGIGGIEISLGPAGGAPGSVAATAADTPETETETLAPRQSPDAPPPEETPPAAEPDAVDVVETATAVSPRAPTDAEPVDSTETAATPPAETPVEIEPIETVRAVPVAAAEIPVTDVPVELAEIAFQPETAPPVETAAVAATEVTAVDDVVEAAGRPLPVEDAPMPKPTPATEAAPKQELVAEIVETPPAPQSKPRPPEPPRAEPTPAPAPETPEPETVRAVDAPAAQVAATAPSAPGAGGKAGTKASPNAGSANDTTGGGMPGHTADFMAQLQAWLEKHKEYPRRARMRRQQGTALLYFVMDRDGQVLQHRLEQSSGHDLLDREVIAMIERAQPLPKLPETMGEPRLELVVPVQFFLR